MDRLFNGKYIEQIVYFLLCHESLTFAQAIGLNIDSGITMVWFPRSLLKTQRRVSSCATTMRVRFIYARRRFVTMADMATLNCNNIVVYGQKHKM